MAVYHNISVDTLVTVDEIRKITSKHFTLYKQCIWFITRSTRYVKVDVECWVTKKDNSVDTSSWLRGFHQTTSSCRFSERCTTCLLSSSFRPTRIIFGPMNVRARHEAYYFIMFINYYTCFSIIYLITHKLKAISCFHI